MASSGLFLELLLELLQLCIGCFGGLFRPSKKFRRIGYVKAFALTSTIRLKSFRLKP